jgi:hypothetical protein
MYKKSTGICIYAIIIVPFSRRSCPADESGGVLYTICPADIATAGSLGRRRAGQLRFGFVAVSAGHIV